MLLILVLFGLLCIFYGRALVEKWSNYRHRKRLSALIPGDEGLPVFGHVFEIGRDAESLPRYFLARAKAARDGWNGEIIKIWLMHEILVFPFTGEMLQHILESKKEISKGHVYDFFEPWLGRGLLLEGGDRWRAKRKMLSPSFHFTMLMGYFDTMNTHSKVLLDVLRSHVEQEFDVYPFLKRFTLDVICDTTMGKELDSQNNPDQPYVKAISKLMYLGMYGTTHPQMWNPLGRWLTGFKKEYDANLRIAHNFTIDVITERMRLIASGEVDANKRAFLDLLIAEQERSNLTVEEIREEVDTFMFAGHDTTSSSLGWILWCIANHEDIQQRVVEELKEIFGNDVSRDCTKDDLARMTYLERCIKESMRLFPPVPFVGRQLDEDLQMGPYMIPRGTSIAISPYLVHRNERIYPNPEIYDPDRFLPDNIASRHPYDYIPFSAGPRNCIGQKFAMHQLKIVVSWLLRTYRLSSNRDFNSASILSEVVLKAGQGVNIVIESR